MRRTPLLNRRQTLTAILALCSAWPLGMRAVAAEPVFAPAAKPQLVLDTGAGEGPAWHPGQGLFFSGREGITRLDRGRRTHLFRRNAGTNGLLFDREGRLLACEPARRRVTRTEPDGTITCSPSTTAASASTRRMT